MLSYFWPILLAAFSNTVYQICAKSLPATLNPLASLTVTYLTAALASGCLYMVTTKSPNLLREYGQINAASFALGIAIVGLEVGMLYSYRVGWPVSTASVVQSALLAVALLVVGYLLFQESITPSKVLGVAICLVGLYFINR